MPQFRDQFDAAQTPQSAAFALKLGHVYNAFVASPPVPLTSSRDDASTNTVLDAFAVQRTTSGTPGVGIGVGLALNVETAAGNIETGAAIRALATDVAGGSEDFDLTFSTMAAGATAAERMRISSSGNVSIGGAGVYPAIFGEVMHFTVQGTDFAGGTQAIARWSNNVPGPGIIMAKSRGPIGTHTIVQANDVLWDLAAYASDGSDFVFSGAITMRATGTPSSGFIETFLQFILDSGTEVVRFASGGNVGVGDTTAARRLSARHDSAATNTVTPVARLWSSSQGTPANGIGAGLEFVVETAANNHEIGATIEAVATDVTGASEDFDVTVNTMAAGAAAAERLRISQNGITPSTRIINKVTTLTDGATVALDARAGNVFKLLAGGDRTISVPTNKPAAGESQRIVIMHEASGADRTLTLTTGSSGAFRFGSTITGLTATLNGLVDYIECLFNQADDRWDVVGYVKGY